MPAVAAVADNAPVFGGLLSSLLPTQGYTAEPVTPPPPPPPGSIPIQSLSIYIGIGIPLMPH